MQAPDGASLDYTTAACGKASAILAQNKDITGVFTVPGWSFGGAGQNVYVMDMPEATPAGAKFFIVRMDDEFRDPETIFFQYLFIKPHWVV